MRIAIIGFGKMAQAILDCLPYKNISCSHIISRKAPAEPQKITILNDVSLLPFDKIDAIIDFSAPEGLLDRTKVIAAAKKPYVIGTTGWESISQEIFSTIQSQNSSLLWGPNFSIGIALYLNICSYANKLLAKHPEFDVGIYERHHRQKADHPSGTAKLLAQQIIENSANKDSSISHLPPGPIEQSQLHVGYSRSGTNPGYYEVLFENQTDAITLSHQAYSRSAYAQGALEAALWLHGKKGIFTFNQIMA